MGHGSDEGTLLDDSNRPDENNVGIYRQRRGPEGGLPVTLGGTEGPREGIRSDRTTPVPYTA